MLRSSTPVLRAILASRSVVVSSGQFTRKMTQSSSQGDSHGSAGHANHGKKSSDTAWLVGSIAVTVPSVLYLLHSSPAKKPDHHGSGHRSSTSALEHEGGASSGAETAKSQMDPTPESVSEAAENARDWANERLGETGEQAGEAPEPATERSKNRAHDGDKGSEEVAGRPNQDGEKDSGDSQGREGTHTPKEPIDEKKKVEKTGGDSKSSETLSNLNMKQNPSKTPSQVDPPATGMKGAGSTDKTSGKQGPSNSDTSHAELHDEKGETISKKPEGPHQTAKLKGAIDPKRQTP